MDTSPDRAGDKTGGEGCLLGPPDIQAERHFIERSTMSLNDNLGERFAAPLFFAAYFRCLAPE